jgi:hypothetical protein
MQTMRNYGRTALSEFLQDQVVYRNLEPADPRLPGLAALRSLAGLPPGGIPRKTEAGYARVSVQLLRRAQALRGISRPIQRLLFIGDTRLLDGTAFANTCLAGEWPGLAFIASENSQPPAVEIVPTETGQSLYLANRWAALAAFDRHARANGFPVDEATAVVVDIDKTALGARGRNGYVIDQARVQAVQDTVAALLGPGFDPEAFRAAYELLNQPEFHSFTTDNQDYVAYLCLMLGAGLYALEAVVAGIRARSFASFEQFMAEVEARERELPAALAAIHGEIYARVHAGDPTPFKSFRRSEYLTTIRRFGQLADSAPVEDLLAQEILVTQELRAAALAWQSQGALLFGLSDKPDEAATPTPELAAQGYQPIHRAVTHAVGESGDSYRKGLSP